MRKLKCGRAAAVVLDRICLFPAAAAAYACCLCTSSNKNNAKNGKEEDDEEKRPLLIAGPAAKHGSAVKKLKDVIAPPPTLAFQLKPKMVVLRVSMHCNGCARKVEKHISKLDGVASYQVDLDTKMVVVTGDIVPFEVLESVSKVVKTAQLWNDND